MASEIIKTETRESDGHTIDTYENGTIRDRTDNKIIAAPPYTLITTENAAEYVSRRIEIARQRATEGMDEAMLKSGKLTVGYVPGEGWKYVVGKITEALNNSTNIRGLAEAGSFLGRATGALVEEKNVTPVYPPPPPQYTPELAVLMLKLCQEVLDRVNAVEGQAVDAEP
jgi:hypothetical protein